MKAIVKELPKDSEKIAWWTVFSSSGDKQTDKQTKAKQNKTHQAPANVKAFWTFLKRYKVGYKIEYHSHQTELR